LQVKDESEVQGPNAYVLFYERIGEGDETTTTPATTPNTTPKGKDSKGRFGEDGDVASAASALASPMVGKGKKKKPSPWLVRKQSLSPGAHQFWPHLSRQRSGLEDDEVGAGIAEGGTADGGADDGSADDEKDIAVTSPSD
jgi:hypothetical protein